MIHFFATTDDLLPVLEAVERRRSLSYTRCGALRSPEVVSFRMGRELPSLYVPAPSESAIASPAYLVALAGTSIALREVSQSDGGRRWFVDQLVNPDTTVLHHGGLYHGDVLLYGRVATASHSRVAVSLQRAFERPLKQQFDRIKAFWVGPQAQRLLDVGVRLTMAAQSPSEYDLSR